MPQGSELEGAYGHLWANRTQERGQGTLLASVWWSGLFIELIIVIFIVEKFLQIFSAFHNKTPKKEVFQGHK